MHAIRELCYYHHSPELGPTRSMLIEGLCIYRGCYYRDSTVFASIDSSSLHVAGGYWHHLPLSPIELNFVNPTSYRPDWFHLAQSAGRYLGGWYIEEGKVHRDMTMIE